MDEAVVSRRDLEGDEPLSPSDALALCDAEFSLIERVPGRCAGQPTLVGTRMRVQDILYAVASHANLGQVSEHFEGRYSVASLTEALQYAAYYLGETVPLDRG